MLTQDRLLPQTGTNFLLCNRFAIGNLPFSVNISSPVDDSCSAKSSLAVVCSLAVLLQLGTVAAFYAFYRKKKSSWKKMSNSGENSLNTSEPFYGMRHSGSVSEVVSPSPSIIH